MLFYLILLLLSLGATPSDAQDLLLAQGALLEMRGQLVVPGIIFKASTLPIVCFLQPLVLNFKMREVVSMQLT